MNKSRATNARRETARVVLQNQGTLFRAIGAIWVPLLACPAVLNRRPARHCWASQQWHPQIITSHLSDALHKRQPIRNGVRAGSDILSNPQSLG